PTITSVTCGVLPSSSQAPSVWFAAMAPPHRNPSGNLYFKSFSIMAFSLAALYPACPRARHAGHFLQFLSTGLCVFIIAWPFSKAIRFHCSESLLQPPAFHRSELNFVSSFFWSHPLLLDEIHFICYTII